MAGVQKVNPTSESPTTTTDSRPVPDPTNLTTQQIQAAVGAQRDVFDVRFAGVEKANDLLQQMANRSPTIAEVWARHDERFVAVWNGIKNERDISDQKFLRVDQQFIQIEKLAAQLKIAGDTAVAAALQAQKEAAGEQTKSSAAAISKSEAATGESIRQLQALFQTSIGGLSAQILDVKSRLDKGEGVGAGRVSATDDSRYERGERRDESKDNRGIIATFIGIVGILISIGTLILLVATRH